jgi:hypothetical protein
MSSVMTSEKKQIWKVLLIVTLQDYSYFAKQGILGYTQIDIALKIRVTLSSSID